MNAIPCLTIQDVANLDGVLGDFLNKAEAELTVVIDRGGNVISQFGDMTVMDVTIIAALAAGSFAATCELARRIGEVEFNALYHQGNGSHMFMNSVALNAPWKMAACLRGMRCNIPLFNY